MRKITILGQAAACALTLFLAAPVLARADESLKFDIAVQPLVPALKAFAEQSNMQLLYKHEAVESATANAVIGSFDKHDALTQLLRGTGLEVVFIAKDAATIRPKTEGPANTQGAAGNKPMDLRLAQGGNTPSAEDRPSETSSENKSAKLEEIVVTATKREERLQDVPVSITALTQESLERTGADKFEDYLGQIAGVHYADVGQGRSRVNIRAVSAQPAGYFEETQNSTAIYIDDFPSQAFSSSWVRTDLRMFDVERVEVLRGPQGTLFGSGALGGALRILTNKPDVSRRASSIETDWSTTDGGAASQRVSGMLNIPLVTDKLAFRGVGYYRNDGGWVDNSYSGKNNVNHGESYGGRFMLGATPTENLSLRFTLTHQDDSVDDVSRVNLDQTPAYDYDSWDPAFTKVKLTFSNLAVEYNFGPALLTSSTTYGESDAALAQGIARLVDTLTPWNTAPGATFGEKTTFVTTTWSQELRLTSQHAGRWQWVAGAFYLDQDVLGGGRWFASTRPYILDWASPEHVEEQALFGEASFHVTPAVTATAGARFFRYDFNTQLARYLGDLVGLYTLSEPVQKRLRESGITPKFALSYKPGDDVMVYTEVAKGFRVGKPLANGGNRDFDGFVFPDGVKSDQLWNYEVGLKSTFLNQTLRLNTALFYIDWKDMPLYRVRPETGSSFNDNAGDATIKGAEVELMWAATDHLLVGSSLSYNDGKLKSVLPGTPYHAGDRLPLSPKFSSSTYIELSTDGWVQQGNTYLRLQHRYNGKQIDNLDNSAGMWGESYNVFDVRAGLTFGNYELALYADNVTNNDAETTRTISTANHLDPNGIAYRLQPRTIGVSFRVRVPNF